MPDSLERLYGPAQPGTSNATLYTAPGSGARVAVRGLEIMNTTDLDATISLAVGGSAATQANCWFYLFNVPPKARYSWSGLLVIESAETLQGLQGTASALTVIISGVEQT